MRFQNAIGHAVRRMHPRVSKLSAPHSCSLAFIRLLCLACQALLIPALFKTL